MQTLEEETHKIIDGAINYNRNHMNNFLESHVVRLIRPLSIMNPVYERASELKVLSVRPRNENELLHLAAYGFDLDNIEAIDLVSNSPRVRIMDMHHLEFPDNKFDVVISGWVLPYSREPGLALAEKMRVLKPGGLFCCGLAREPPGSDGAKMVHREGSVNYLSARQLIADIPTSLERVEFRQEPLDPSRKGAILLIVRKS